MSALNSPLSQLRKEIDAIDKKMLVLFKRRFEICQRIALLKEKKKLPIVQENREKILLENFSKKALKVGFSPGFIKSFYRLVFRESKRIQQQIIVRLTKGRRSSNSLGASFLTKKPKKVRIKRSHR